MGSTLTWLPATVGLWGTCSLTEQAFRYGNHLGQREDMSLTHGVDATLTFCNRDLAREPALFLSRPSGMATTREP